MQGNVGGSTCAIGEKERGNESRSQSKRCHYTEERNGVTRQVTSMVGFGWLVHGTIEKREQKAKR